MITRYRIHYTSKTKGQDAVVCESDSDWCKVHDDLVSDPDYYGIWTEFYDDVEGWKGRSRT